MFPISSTSSHNTGPLDLLFPFLYFSDYSEENEVGDINIPDPLVLSLFEVGGGNLSFKKRENIYSYHTTNMKFTAIR